MAGPLSIREGKPGAALYRLEAPVVSQSPHLARFLARRAFQVLKEGVHAISANSNFYKAFVAENGHGHWQNTSAMMTIASSRVVQIG